MAKIKFENITEGLSVPAFYMAYRELGDKYKLWGKRLEELVPFFDNLSAKSLRRVLVAFGIRAIINDDRIAFYAGGVPGLLLLDITVPTEALNGKSGRMYICPHCNRGVDAGFLDRTGVSLLATLYVAQAVERLTKQVVEFCMIQPIDICFPYSGKKGWHEADIQRILVEQVLAEKLGLPQILSSEQSKEFISRLTNQLGFDIEKWAETRARNIRRGIEPEPDFYGYKRIDENGGGRP